MPDHRRRDFLGWLGASTLAAAAAGRLRAQTARLLPDTSPASGAARADSGAAPTAPWDMSWVDRVQGDARAVFDSPAVSDGDALWRATQWRKDYVAVYPATNPEKISTVLVIRHAAIPLAMDDSYWKQFDVGKELKLKDQDDKDWTTVNPIRAARPGASGDEADVNLEHFMATGGIVLACHMAFMGRVVSRYRKAGSSTMEQAEAEARSHVIPGIILQPSGIFAALRAQQAGCSYIVGS
jgi:hypothetical protein